MAEINQEPASRLKARSLRMAGKAMCAFPTCVAARIPAKIERNTIDHSVLARGAVVAGPGPGGEPLTAVGLAFLSLEGTDGLVACSPDGERGVFSKLRFPLLTFL
jgi:hypothetical protein